MSIKNIPNNIPNTKPDKYAKIPKPYLDVAEGMEAQFVNMMLNEMQKFQSKDDDNATKFYKSLLTNERAQMMAKSNNNIGLKDIILEQILPQHLKSNNAQALDMYNKQRTLIKEVHNE